MDWTESAEGEQKELMQSKWGGFQCLPLIVFNGQRRELVQLCRFLLK